MTANSLTDQILANRPEVRRVAASVIHVSADVMAEDAELFANRIAGSLSGIDRAVIGEVLLHASDMYLAFATSNGRDPVPPPALIAVHLLGEAGERLYGADAPNATTT